MLLLTNAIIAKEVGLLVASAKKAKWPMRVEFDGAKFTVNDITGPLQISDEERALSLDDVSKIIRKRLRWLLNPIGNRIEKKHRQMNCHA